MLFFIWIIKKSPKLIDLISKTDLNNYEEVKLIGKNYKEFPDLPVFHKKQKRKVWIFIDEIRIE